jgi:phage host-nuclease inhibitor protein Gam
MVEGSTDALDVLSRITRTALDAKAMAGATGELMKEYAERKSRMERREEAMRSLAMRLMKAANLPKAELACGTISVRSTPPAVLITDETMLDDRFWRVKREPNRSAVKDALKAGEFVAGAELSNGGETLSIRVA